MAEYIVMPKLGLTMKEGTIREWLKNEGDPIAMGDLIFEMETDKITKKFESANEGTLLKILVPKGKVKVQEPVAIIGRAGEDYSSLIPEGTAPPETSADAPAAAAAPKPEALAKPGGKVRISPKAKKLAEELGVDYTVLEGTGPGGAISAEDIKQAKVSVKATPMARKTAEELGVDLAAMGKEGRVYKKDVLLAARPDQAEPARETMSQMRSIIAARMKESQEIAAAINLTVTVDMTRIIELREALKVRQKVSYNDILVYIVSRVLRQFPILNCSVEGEEIVYHNAVHMGVAVSLDNGLMVPVIRNADELSIRAIGEKTRQLADGCRSGEISPDDLEGSTFTVTNLGMFGIESFTPIINQPNVAILGINAIRKQPVVTEDDCITIRSVMALSLTVDHRIVDGAMAAQFLAALRETMETPSLLML